MDVYKRTLWCICETQIHDLGLRFQNLSCTLIARCHEIPVSNLKGIRVIPASQLLDMRGKEIGQVHITPESGLISRLESVLDCT